MTDFPTLLYISTCEIPTLFYTWSLKKVPLSGRASLYRPLYGVPPPRRGGGGAISPVKLPEEHGQ